MRESISRFVKIVGGIGVVCGTALAVLQLYNEWFAEEKGPVVVIVPSSSSQIENTPVTPPPPEEPSPSEPIVEPDTAESPQRIVLLTLEKKFATRVKAHITHVLAKAQNCDIETFEVIDFRNEPRSGAAGLFGAMAYANISVGFANNPLLREDRVEANGLDLTQEGALSQARNRLLEQITERLATIVADCQ